MLARIFGKSNVYNLKIEIFGELKNFDFLKVEHYEHGDVLVQIYNIERDSDKLIGFCKVIGFREKGILKNIKTPFGNDANIELAEDDFIKKIIGLNKNQDGFLGVLEDHPNLRIELDLKKVISKHLAVLAKSGAGKSYSVGVLIEEILNKNIPVLILDPHNEYSTIKFPNTNKKDLERLKLFGLKPRGFLENVKEYSPDTNINPQAEKLRLDIKKLTPHEFINSLPQKLSPSQSSLIYSIISNLNNRIDLDEIIFSLSNEESNSKWGIISLLEMFKKLNVYSSMSTPLNEIIRYKQASIISLKGVNPEVQEIFVAGLLRDLYEARKKEEIPPFFIVLEEAHNFAPERSFGEVKSSKIIRTIASEGRKFGIGLCVISQRPAKVDKNVISQCSTQLILKITNPNDLKSVISSSEGVTTESEQEIQRLNIGTGLLTGIVDVPLKVNIRPRMSKHGGETVDITLDYEKYKNFEKKIEKEENKNNTEEESISKNVEMKQESSKENDNKNRKREFFQIVGSEISEEDAKVLLNVNDVKTLLVPSVFVKLSNGSNILVEKMNGYVVKKVFPFEGYKLPFELNKLTDSEKRLIKEIFKLNTNFNPAEILLNTNMMYNEILRICNNLEKKNILKKEGQGYSYKNIEFLKNIKDLNFVGNQKFEEVSYDEKVKENFKNDEIESLFNLFSKVENIKEVFIINYVENK